tara:strand:+ start:583 stop:990 length:408 start_codon:yes stop_codon:yes gene_type:complete
MSEKDKKILESYKTAAGAQQAGSDADFKKLVERVNKDIDKIMDRSMTRAEFKKKYGRSVGAVQKIIYAAAAGSRSKNWKKRGYSEAASIADEYEKKLKKESKKSKAKVKTDRKFTPQDYRKGGMVLSVVDNRNKK